MMYACGINSGWAYFAETVNLVYLDNDLKINISQYTLYSYYTSLGYDLKPFFGIISDTFFPFRYRYFWS